MPSPHYGLTEVFEIIGDWYDGNTDKNSTYLTIRFLWWNRVGTILQFIAGLSILVEIIGKERMRNAMEDIENSINLKKLTELLKKAFDFTDDIHDGIGYGITVSIAGVYFLTTLLTSKDGKSGEIIKHLRETKEEKANRVLDTIQTFISDNLWLLIILGVVAIIIFLWEDLQILFRNILGFPTVLIFQIARIIGLIIIEFFILKPAILYIKISQNDKQLKLFSFLFLILGFILSFIFS